MAIFTGSRRNFLKVAGAVGAAASLESNTAAAVKPNIVFLFSDEHRYQSMSFTETPPVQTPHMAQMAAQGTQFKYTVSNNPVCMPYRSMLITGKWCYSSGVLENNGTIGPWEETIADAFRTNGYVTGYTGKWHAGNYPELAGFDWHMHWEDTDDHWNSTWTDLHGTGQTNLCLTYQPVKMTDQALEFIENNKTNSFFLMVSWNPPHANFTDAPEELEALYTNTTLLPWRDNVTNNASWREEYEGYHAHITAIDNELGRVIEKLDQLNILWNTIIVYTSDHGSMMKSHGSTNKRRPEEESCRVPFIIQWKGIPTNQVNQVRNELFSSIDIFPTLFGLAKLPVPGICEGQDFSPLLRNKPGPDPDSQFLMHIAKKNTVDNLSTYHTPFFRGVRGKRFTYTVNMNGPWQLFDNSADPLQMTNLISDAAYASDRTAMQAKLDQWIVQVENPHMHTNYCTMPLTNRIYRQALLHGKGVRLSQFMSQLKLSPEQEDQLKPIELTYYGSDGRPLAGYTWATADAAYRAGVKTILTADQLAVFVQLEVLEAIALQ